MDYDFVYCYSKRDIFPHKFYFKPALGAPVILSASGDSESLFFKVKIEEDFQLHCDLGLIASKPKLTKKDTRRLAQNYSKRTKGILSDESHIDFYFGRSYRISPEEIKDILFYVERTRALERIPNRINDSVIDNLIEEHYEILSMTMKDILKRD